MSAALDVAIIGAGAAGVAAGRRLAAAGRSILLVEAADRVGGRAWTVQAAGLPLDLGCGWLHSGDRNPWTALAPELGLSVDRAPPPWGRQADDRGFPPDAQAQAWEAFEAFGRRLRAAPPASDRAADVLEPGQPWNGYLEALSGYINGAELAHLSICDYLAYADADTGVNWRVRQGYGTLIATAAAALPTALSTPVQAIETSGRGVRLVTAAGTIEAATAIVTLPTAVLASGAVRLPRGAADRIEAACDLPLGLADKVFLALDREDGFEPDTQVLGRPGEAKTGSYHLRPFGRPVIEGFFGGATAGMLEGAGEDAMARFAIEELAGLYGADIRKRLTPLARSCWGRSPLAGGSYSHARPGRAGARAVLAAPFEERLFFAGEACSAQDFSTAHGACETGLAAAELIVARWER